MSNAISVVVGADHAPTDALPSITSTDVADVPVRQKTTQSINAFDLRPKRSGLFATARGRDGLPPEKLSEDTKIVFRGIEMTLKAAERVGIVERTEDGEGWREVSTEERTTQERKIEHEQRTQLAAEMAPDTPIEQVLPGVTKELEGFARACASHGLDMTQQVATFIGNPDTWMSTQAPTVARAMGVTLDQLADRVDLVVEAVRLQFANESEAFGADGYAFLEWVETQPTYRAAALRAFHGDFRPMRSLAKQYAETPGALPSSATHDGVKRLADGREVVAVTINGKRVEISARNARQLGLM